VQGKCGAKKSDTGRNVVGSPGKTGQLQAGWRGGEKVCKRKSDGGKKTTGRKGSVMARGELEKGGGATKETAKVKGEEAKKRDRFQKFPTEPKRRMQKNSPSVGRA